MLPAVAKLWVESQLLSPIRRWVRGGGPFVRAIEVVGLLSLGHLAPGKNDLSRQGAACPGPVSCLDRVFGHVETPDYAFHKFIARLCSNQSFLRFGGTAFSSPTSAGASTQAVAARLTSTASMGGVQRRPGRGLSGLFQGLGIYIFQEPHSVQMQVTSRGVVQRAKQPVSRP